jgi:hypothetical protein
MAVKVVDGHGGPMQQIPSFVDAALSSLVVVVMVA